MTRKRGRAWCVDDTGISHLPDESRTGHTLCGLPTNVMAKTWDGSLFCNCSDCCAVVKTLVAQEMAHAP